jgi:HK97 family phage portal protein
LAGFFDAVRAFFDPPIAPRGEVIGRVVNLGPDESRSIWTVWGSEETTSNTIAGVQVSAETALHAPAVWACVRLISGAIAGLPLHAYRGTGNERTEINLPEWIRRPNPKNPNLTKGVHIQQVVTSMLLDGNAFVYVIRAMGEPQRMKVLDPATVTIEAQGDDVVYRVTGADRLLTPDDIIHIPYLVVPGKERGLNPVDAAKESIGLALAADEYGAAYFGNGATLSGTLEFPVGAEPSPAELERLKKDFAKKHVGSRKSHAVGALTGGATYKPISGSNRDSQLLELREFQVEDIGRLYGVPPHMIGSQKPGAVAYASVEQRNIDFVTHGLQPVIEKLEDGYERALRGQRTYFKFNVDGLLRGDAKSRWEAYGIALDKKVMLREEVRSKEDLGYIGDLGFLETPNNNAPEEPAASQEPAA